MDYEKKYKEMKARVLEIGRGYVKGVDFSKPRQIAEYIDPKLGESGDEEIRQLLVRFVTYDMSDNYSDDISKEECLAWLEKQNEQKHISDFSTLRTWKYVVDAVLTEKEGIGQYLDSPFTEEVAKKLQKRFGNIKQTPLSEEDIKALNRISAILVDASEVKNWWKEYRLIEKEEMIRLTDFLKSLIDRIYPQPTWWNEEDEAMYQGIIETEQYMLDVVYGRKNFSVGNEDLKEECIKELAWLKSLKDRIK